MDVQEATYIECCWNCKHFTPEWPDCIYQGGWCVCGMECPVGGSTGPLTQVRAKRGRIEYPAHFLNSCEHFEL